MAIFSTLGLVPLLIFAAIAGILIGASYALYQKVQQTHEKGVSYGDIFRQQGFFFVILLILWMSFFSYLRIQIGLTENTESAANPNPSAQVE